MTSQELVVNGELDLDQKIWKLISALAQEKRVQAEMLIKTFDISMLQLNILDVLCYAIHGTLSVNRIIESMADASPNVSRSLKKLEALRLITKHRSAEDQRIVFVQVTKEGRQLRQQIKPQLPNEKLNLSETESRTLYELLSRLQS